MKIPNDKNKGAKEQLVKITIAKEGSLGLLALGHRGLKIWRDVRDKKNNDAKA